MAGMETKKMVCKMGMHLMIDWNDGCNCLEGVAVLLLLLLVLVMMIFEET